MSEPLLKLGPTPPPVATPAPQAPPPARGLKWIDAAQAAVRARMNEGAVRRLCAEKWLAQGLAEQRRPGSGGRSKWYVREDADPRFAPVKSPEQLSAEFDMSHLTQAQRDEVLRRERIIKAWENARRGGLSLGLTVAQATDQFLDVLAHRGLADVVPPIAPVKLCRATLHNWYAGWRREGGRRGLVDGRAKTATEAAEQQADEFRHALVELYLSSKLSKSKCFDVIAYGPAREHGWTIPGNRTARRWLEELPQATVIKSREGEKAAVDKVDPYVVRDYSTIASNEWWCSDHHRFDVMVALPPDAHGEVKHARPWLHAWQDVRSRKIVGWSIVLHDPNADLILRVVQQAIGDFGVPTNVLLDNGKDFDSRQLQGKTKKQRRSGVELSADEIRRVGGAFSVLGVRVVHCWPYHGQSKPIERFFGTVADRFCKSFETYTGPHAQGKPEKLQHHVDAGHAPTLAEFTQAFSEWLESDYHGRLHLGDSMHGQTPDQVYEACLEARRTLPAETLEFACCPRVGPVKVRQNGVTYKGITFGANDPTLIEHFGKSVMLAVPQKLSHVTVCDLEGRSIVRVAANQKSKWSPDAQDVRNAIAEKKKAGKVAKAYHAARPKLAMDVADLALQSAHARAGRTRARRPLGDPTPPPVQMVKTVFDEPSNAFQPDDEAAPLRLAVGGENDVVAPSVFSYQRQEVGDE